MEPRRTALTDEDKLAIHARYAAATRAGDAAAMAAISEPHAVVWHNHDEVEVALEQSARTLRWLHRTMPDVAWDDVSVLPTPEGFVWRAVLTGNAPGGPVRAHTCMVVTVSEAGKVVRTDEYLDPAALRPLRDSSQSGT
jgi:ketosteroid isomerase-like protein